jgi:hypothetical protein
MASESTRDTLRASRKGIGSSKFVAKPKPETSALEDPEKQDEILNPAPLVATIGGEPVEIHELAAKYSRALCGLLQGIIVDLFSGPKGDGATFSTRLAALVAERYSDRMLPFIARSLKAAGETKDEDLAAIVADIDTRMRYDEMTAILINIINKNKIIESLTPRNGAAKKV